MALGKRLSRNRAIRRQTVDKRDDADLSLLRRNCASAKPMYLGKQLASAPAGANLAKSQLGAPLRRPADADVSWFGKVQAKTYDAASAAASRTQNPLSSSGRRDQAAKERLGGHAPSAPPRGLYTVEAEESWQEVYRSRYRQLLLDKFLGFECLGGPKARNILDEWREILKKEPYGSEDPEVRNIRHEVVEEFVVTLDLGACPEPSLPSYRPLTPDPDEQELTPPESIPETTAAAEPEPARKPGGQEALVAPTSPEGGDSRRQRKGRTKTVWKDVDGDGAGIPLD